VSSCNASGADCVTGSVRFAVPQPAESQRTGNRIDAAMIFARSQLSDMIPRSIRIKESPSAFFRNFAQQIPKYVCEAPNRSNDFQLRRIN
jgi:hypothetical protein